MSRDASSTSSSDQRPAPALARRGMLAGLGLGLAGCGWRPLYAPVSNEATGVAADVVREMAAIRVAPMYDRPGQIMQRSLERRFQGNGGHVPARYDLTVLTGLDVEVLGYRPDGIITRVRVAWRADWTLMTRDDPPVQVSRGQARAFDAYNVAQDQFFAADMSNLAMQERLVQETSDQVYIRLAADLRSWLARAAGA